jgi:3-oxoacyl-[acyl-carrier-protein] synthase II
VSAGVVITGAGVVSPVAQSADDLHRALCEPRVNPDRAHAVIDTALLDAAFGKRNTRPLDRLGRLTAAAVRQALVDSGWTADRLRDHEVGLVVGTMLSGVGSVTEFDRRGLTAGPHLVSPLDFPNTVLNAAAGQSAIWFGLRGVNATIAAGEASGLAALIYAADLIRWGRAEALVAGGADELGATSISLFETAGTRRYACVGEGAAFVTLESSAFASRRGVRPIGEVVGVASAFANSPCRTDVTVALTSVIREALREAQVMPDDVDLIALAANGVEEIGEAENAVLEATFRGLRRHPTRLDLRAAIGETLAASGPISMIAALRTLTCAPSETVAGPKMALINAISESGNCCAVVLKDGRRHGDRGCG